MEFADIKMRPALTLFVGCDDDDDWFDCIDYKCLNDILEFTVKFFASITLVIPIAMGLYEYFYCRTVQNLHTDEPEPSLIWLIALSLTLIHPYIIGMDQLWLSSFSTAFIETMDPDEVEFLSLQNLTDEQLQILFSRKEVVPKIPTFQISNLFENPELKPLKLEVVLPLMSPPQVKQLLRWTATYAPMVFERRGSEDLLNILCSPELHGVERACCLEALKKPQLISLFAQTTSLQRTILLGDMELARIASLLFSPDFKPLMQELITTLYEMHKIDPFLSSIKKEEILQILPFLREDQIDHLCGVWLKTSFFFDLINRLPLAALVTQYLRGQVIQSTLLCYLHAENIQRLLLHFKGDQAQFTKTFQLILSEKYIEQLIVGLNSDQLREILQALGSGAIIDLLKSKPNALSDKKYIGAGIFERIVALSNDTKEKAPLFLQISIAQIKQVSDFVKERNDPLKEKLVDLLIEYGRMKEALEQRVFGSGLSFDEIDSTRFLRLSQEDRRVLLGVAPREYIDSLLKTPIDEQIVDAIPKGDMASYLAGLTQENSPPLLNSLCANVKRLKNIFLEFTDVQFTQMIPRLNESQFALFLSSDPLCKKYLSQRSLDEIVKKYLNSDIKKARILKLLSMDLVQRLLNYLAQEKPTVLPEALDLLHVVGQAKELAPQLTLEGLRGLLPHVDNLESVFDTLKLHEQLLALYHLKTTDLIPRLLDPKTNGIFIEFLSHDYLQKILCDQEVMNGPHFSNLLQAILAVDSSKGTAILHKLDRTQTGQLVTGLSNQALMDLFKQLTSQKDLLEKVCTLLDDRQVISLLSDPSSNKELSEETRIQLLNVASMNGFLNKKEVVENLTSSDLSHVIKNRFLLGIDIDQVAKMLNLLSQDQLSEQLFSTIYDLLANEYIYHFIRRTLQPFINIIKSFPSVYRMNRINTKGLDPFTFLLLEPDELTLINYKTVLLRPLFKDHVTQWQYSIWVAALSDVQIMCCNPGTYTTDQFDCLENAQLSLFIQRLTGKNLISLNLTAGTSVEQLLHVLLSSSVRLRLDNMRDAAEREARTNTNDQNWRVHSNLSLSEAYQIFGLWEPDDRTYEKAKGKYKEISRRTHTDKTTTDDRTVFIKFSEAWERIQKDHQEKTAEYIQAFGFKEFPLFKDTLAKYAASPYRSSTMESGFQFFKAIYLNELGIAWQLLDFQNCPETVKELEGKFKSLKSHEQEAADYKRAYTTLTEHFRLKQQYPHLLN